MSAPSNHPNEFNNHIIIQLCFHGCSATHQSGITSLRQEKARKVLETPPLCAQLFLPALCFRVQKCGKDRVCISSSFHVYRQLSAVQTDLLKCNGITRHLIFTFSKCVLGTLLTCCHKSSLSPALTATANTRVCTNIIQFLHAQI